MVENSNISNQILDNAVSTELVGTAIDISEIGLDKLLDENFLKEIPCIKTIYGVFKGAVHIRDKIFMAKVAKFLLSLRNVSKAEREAFQKKLSSNSKIKRKLGDNLFLLLDRFNDLEKPEILAKVFTYFLKEKIDYDAFRRLGAAIELAFIDDLRRITGSMRTPSPDMRNVNYLANLIHTGLVAFEGGKSWNNIGQIEYQLSSLGHLYVDIMTGGIEKRTE